MDYLYKFLIFTGVISVIFLLLKAIKKIHESNEKKNIVYYKGVWDEDDY